MITRFDIFIALSFAFTGTAALADNYGEHGAKFLLNPQRCELYLRAYCRSDGNDMGTGIELDINCPKLTTPRNRNRQRINLTSFDNDAIGMGGFELNSHCMIKVTESLELDFGSCLYSVQTEQGAEEDSTWGV